MLITIGLRDVSCEQSGKTLSLLPNGIAYLNVRVTFGKTTQLEAIGLLPA